MKIRLSDLKNRPCDRYYDYIKEHYGEDEFDPKEVFKVLNARASDVKWLIINYEPCQTKDWFEYYKSLNPCGYNVVYLIKSVEICQTKEWFEYFKSLNPNEDDVMWLKNYCKKFRKYKAKNENKI